MQSLGVGVTRPLPDKVHRDLFPGVPKKDIVRMGVHGDGTCFYHSVCAALNYKGYLTASKKDRQRIGQEFRCGFKDHMTRSKWKQFQKDFPQHMNRSFETVEKTWCTPSEWAEEDTIKMVSKYLGLNIVFLDASKDKFYCHMQGDPTQEDTVVIAWIDHAHFEPILHIYERCKDHAHLRGRFNPRNEPRIVTDLKRAFDKHCLPVEEFIA